MTAENALLLKGSTVNFYPQFEILDIILKNGMHFINFCVILVQGPRWSSLQCVCSSSEHLDDVPLLFTSLSLTVFIYKMDIATPVPQSRFWLSSNAR